MSLEDYFDKLEARSVDPDTFIEDSGKLVRVSKRRERNQRYLTKNRKNAVSRTAAWKVANPDKAAAQIDRRANKNYHRPYASIDAEGEDILGFDEVDAAFLARVQEAKRRGEPEPQMRGPDGKPNANVYPLHRTTLWAAGGWKRRHTPEAITAGVGSPTEGEELPPYFLCHEDKRPHHSDEIIEWLLSLPENYGPEQGFPDGVNFIPYSFNYDATQVFADLHFPKVWEITRKKYFKSKRKTKYPTLYKGYAIDFLKSKWLRLWKLRDHNKPYKEKLDKNGNVKLKANGKPEMEIDAIAYIWIDDAFGFYQSPFTKATKPLIKQEYVEKKDYETIEYMKDHRDEFANLSMDEIKHYCHLELVFLSKALTVLRDGFDKMGETDAVYAARVEEAKIKGSPPPPRRGLKLRTWGGSGFASGAKIRHENLKEKHYSPDITVSKINMTDWQKQSHLSFIGGRIEAIKQGYAMLRELFLYDIASAYPSAMLELPSMRDGKWIAHGPIGIFPKAVVGGSNILSMFRVKWKFPEVAPDGINIPFNPFPYRTKRRHILFPSTGHA